jgi:hypothetical protein
MFSRELSGFEGHVGNVAKLVLRALHHLTGARIIRSESQVTFGLLRKDHSSTFTVQRPNVLGAQ